jgi:hypothetical protein
MSEINGITLHGDEESFDRKPTIKHLLAAKEKMQKMFLLVESGERDGSTLPRIGADCVDVPVE